MTEAYSGKDLIHYGFDLARNFQVALMDPRYRDQVPSDEQHSYSRSSPLIHATTLESLVALDETGRLLPISALEAQGLADSFDRLHLGTDELDRQLGLDNFTFWGLGRAKANPAERPVFLVLDSTSHLPGSLVSFEDIADMGAVVSPEGFEQLLIMGMRSRDIKSRTRNATRNYFRSLMRGEDFPEIFARYLSGHHSSLHDYLATTYFPYGEVLFEDSLDKIDRNTGRTVDMREAWGGPQVLLGAVNIGDIERIYVDDFWFNRHGLREQLGSLSISGKIEFFSDHVSSLDNEQCMQVIQSEVDEYGKGAIFHTAINMIINASMAKTSW